ncbi:MAG: lipopolysaccharide assembly protein LapB [Gammaproteobacteria bacterium]|nr:lipopolysaccharide assembly protein LapB [Gammaproteobacteria bacterium]MYJ52488.1 lipopolysaccharide assembly protein LapB [Gammaproteobacteria bacterium]
MDPVWLLLLLPLAATSGWFVAAYERSSRRPKAQVPDTFFKGLNCLLNDQPDEALKIFLDAVELDSDTVEMHMALGNMFRQRGEVDRATRIHENLVSRTDIDNEFRSQALFELAQDYFRAGLYDRAENLLQELRKIKEFMARADRLLLQIYDQEREWEKAIEVSVELNRYSESDYAHTISHLYCEVAESNIRSGNYPEAESNIALAFKYDQKCIRAVLQSGRLAAMRGNHTNAIAIWRSLEYLAPDYLGEVVSHIANSYKVLGDNVSLRQFLESAIEKNADSKIIDTLVELTREERGDEAGRVQLLELVRKHPTLEGVLQVIASDGRAAGTSGQEKDYRLLAGLISRVVETGRQYNCRNCGFQSNSLHWQCPGCKAWGAMQRSRLPKIKEAQQGLG